MRSKFPGYYTPSKDKFDQMWNNCVFVLDTNVLLDLFRFSDEAVESLIKLIETKKDRIWIPFQVSLEYHKNLNNVIGDQIVTYKKTIGVLEEFKNSLESKRSHPFLSNILHEEMQKFCNKFDDELTKKRCEIERLITDNPIKDKLAELLDDRVGEKLDDEILSKYYKEGEQRYADKQPPGYMDAKNKGGNDRYGDLIIWKEILQKSKNDQVDIIFITSDAKEDWFLKHSGKNLGPRPELTHEFERETKRSFYAYVTARFLELTNEYFSSDINQDIIDEVKVISRVENHNSLVQSNDLRGETFSQGATTTSVNSENNPNSQSTL